MKLVYKVTTGKPYKVRTLKYDIQDSKIKEYMRQDSAVTLLSEGMYFDVNVLDAERQRITNKTASEWILQVQQRVHILYRRYRP